MVFGANMTTLTFGISRALGATWGPGDEVVVTRLDHDANVSPWIRAARDAGATVRFVPFHEEDCTLDLEAFRGALSSRTKLVAFGAASNAVGTLNPVEELTRLAHEVGALVYVDAVHSAERGARWAGYSLRLRFLVPRGWGGPSSSPEASPSGSTTGTTPRVSRYWLHAAGPTVTLAAASSSMASRAAWTCL